MGYFIIGLALCAGSLPLSGSVGCMANSKHAYKCNEEGDICCNPYDYKQWHYVYCACPCNEYDARDKKGKCQNCWHYHEPAEQIVIRGKSQEGQAPRQETSTKKRCR